MGNFQKKMKVVLLSYYERRPFFLFSFLFFKMMRSSGLTKIGTDVYECVPSAKGRRQRCPGARSSRAWRRRPDPGSPEGSSEGSCSRCLCHWSHQWMSPGIQTVHWGCVQVTALSNTNYKKYYLVMQVFVLDYFSNSSSIISGETLTFKMF